MLKKIFKSRVFISIVAVVAAGALTCGAVILYFNTQGGRNGTAITLKDLFSAGDKTIVGNVSSGKSDFVEGLDKSAAVATGNYVTKGAAISDDDLVIGGSTKHEDGSRYYAQSFVSTNGSLIMNGYFADNMMFQQNRPIVVWGREAGTREVKVKLVRDRDKTVVSQNKTKAASGSFYIRLPAIKGSFDTYTLVVEGSANKKLSNILIGELWVAGGQSNMEMPVKMMLTAQQELQNPNNSNIRFFQEIRKTIDNGDNFPPTPQFDVTSQFKWGKGNDRDFVGEMSAIGYVFAKSLYQKLNVPIGVIDIAIGGTSIEPWLSREAIEGNVLLSDYLKSKNRFLKTTEINKSPDMKYNQMSVQYNKRVSPIKGTNVKGVLWYQGEGNTQDCFSEYYANALRTLTKEWSSAFGSTSKQLPFVFVNIAPYNYGPDYVTLLNEKFTKIWTENKSKFALVATYDISLEYKLPTSPNPVHPIHPIDKAPVGERCAMSAMGIAYASKSEYMSPVFDSAVINGNKINVKFTHAGSGLRTRNGEPEIIGFAIAGSNGKFIPANARIISKDTVEVYSPFVTSPQFATYGFTDFNMGSNLANSIGYPAIPFRSEDKMEFMYYRAKQWTFARSVQNWIISSDTDSRYQTAWDPMPDLEDRITAISADKGIAVKGKFAMKIAYNADKTIPVSFGATEMAVKVQGQYNPYSKLTFTVYNPDNRSKTFTDIKIRSGGRYYKAGSSITIPAKGSKTISADIWTLKDKNNNIASNISSVLNDVQGIYFEFSDGQAGTLYVHSILFRS